MTNNETWGICVGCYQGMPIGNFGITPEHSRGILCRYNMREELSEEEESIKEEEIVLFRKLGIALEHLRDTLWWRRMHHYEKEESSKEEESIASGSAICPLSRAAQKQELLEYLRFRRQLT